MVKNEKFEIIPTNIYTETNANKSIEKELFLWFSDCKQSKLHTDIFITVN